MLPDLPLRDHRLLLVLPLRQATPHHALWTPAKPDEATRLYLDEDARKALYSLRYELRPATSTPVVRKAVLVQTPLNGPAALALVLEAPTPTLHALLHTANDARMLRRWYPSHTPRPWTWEGKPYALLGDLLPQLLQAHQPAFEDPRALTLTFAAFDTDPGDAVRYALTYADPPDMPSPPRDLLADAMTRFAYRRWADAGTTWTFCHHGAAAVTTDAAAASWMAPLFEGVYLDMALMVALAAARRATTKSIPRGEPWTWAPCFPRFSEQDQGRHLLRAWLAAIDADRQDLARLGYDPPPPVPR